MKPPFLIAGNWKMYKTPSQSQEFIRELEEIPHLWREGAEVLLFVPFTSLPIMKEVAGKVSLGAQNFHWESEGAFTGEISPVMLKEFASHLLIGHSERRHIFGESDEWICRKLHSAIHHQFSPVLCVGETRQQREEGLTFSVIRSQLEGAFQGLGREDIRRVTIAYEPVWAIGTGQNATPEQAQEVHRMIRSTMKEQWGNDLSPRILYGGSVKPENSGELLDQPDIDGFLIGGASLKVSSFSAIIETSLKRYHS